MISVKRMFKKIKMTVAYRQKELVMHSEREHVFSFDTYNVLA